MRVDFERALEFRLGGGQLPALVQGNTQGCMHLRAARSQFISLPELADRLWEMPFIHQSEGQIEMAVPSAGAQVDGRLKRRDRARDLVALREPCTESVIGLGR